MLCLTGKFQLAVLVYERLSGLVLPIRGIWSGPLNHSTPSLGWPAHVTTCLRSVRAVILAEIWSPWWLSAKTVVRIRAKVRLHQIQLPFDKVYMSSTCELRHQLLKF